MLSAIWDVLKSILCVLENLVLSILAVFIMGFNAIIAGLAATVALVIAVLPDMPDAPTWVDDVPWLATSLGFVAWLFPVNVLVALVATVILLWIAVQGVGIILRWVKAI